MDTLLYWEDFAPGDVLELGSHTFTAEEIIEFARRWDPQSFHTDPQAASASAFGGLVASGWHTCAVGMRLMVETHVGRSASLGSPGLENIRWLAPVRPGDTVTYRRRITHARPSRSRPGVGLVRSRWEAVNQRGELVMTMEGWGMFARRDGARDGA